MIHILATTFPSQLHVTGRGRVHYYEIRLPGTLNTMKEALKYAE